MTTSPNAHEDIDVVESDTRVRAGSFLLDVRRDDEWERGHAPDAVHLPLDQLSARHTELPADREIVVICRSGARSAAAADALLGAGYQAVNVAGGMLAWVDAGLPCVTDAGSPGEV